MPTEAAAFFKQTSWNFVEDVKNGMIWSMLAYNRTHEYLHKQLVRKGRVSRVFIDTKQWGRVYFCKDSNETSRDVSWKPIPPEYGAYNINSGGVQPYTRDGVNDLGLSQLFNKQKPTETYNGPSEGQITDYFWVKKTKVSDFTFYCKNSGGKFNASKIIEYVKPLPDTPKDPHGFEGRAKGEGLATALGLENYEYADGYVLDVSEGTALLYYAVAWYSAKEDKITWRAYGKAYPLFYADSDAPVIGVRKWIKNWNVYNGVAYHTKTKKGRWYKQIIPPVLFIVSAILVAVSVGTYGSIAAATIGAIAGSGAVTLAGVMATLAIAGAIGGFIATLGMLSGNKSLSKFGRVVGWIGTIGSIYTAAKDFFFQSAAAQNASTATNQAVAGAAGANQTCQLYNGVSVSSWAGAGSSAGLGSAATQGASIGGFAAAGATSTSQLYLTTALKALSVGSKSFALVQDIRGAFRKAGDTQDTDMQEQSAEEKVVSVNSDADMDEEYAKRRFYERDAEYDIGLEGGTLISIDDSVLDEPNSAMSL